MEYNLVLIIGNNPLPNLVVSKYLLSKSDHQLSSIYLIYSEENRKQQGTREYAENLKILLENPGIQIEPRPLSDVGNSKKIIEDLNKYEWNKSHKYHLNYTGGTKTMSVHVYEFFKGGFNKNIDFSYLDVRTYSLYYDNGTYDPTNGDLRDYVKVTIDELLQLHGYKIKKGSFENNTFNDALNEFRDAIKKNEYGEFIKWYKNVRYIKSECTLNRVNDFKDILKQEYPINLKCIADKFGENIPDVAKRILDAFPEEKKIHNIQDGQYKLWVPEEGISNNHFKERVKNTWEYLDGKWLEHYVYEELKPKLEEKGFSEGRNFGWPLRSRNNKGKDFELDIFIIKGYQLIAISITTDDQTYICKSKGFEVIHRARQIGGDESTAILITALGAKNVSGLEKDLHINTGTSEERFKVFGIDEWKNISEKILSFLNI